MEIEKGFCNFCSADQVLCEVKKRKFQKLLKSLFNHLINVELLEDILESFRVCPLCHEKFILLDTRYKAIKSHKKGSYCDNCILCGDEDELYKIKNWQYFDRLSIDFDFRSETVLICPACLVYLDIRNTIKQQLLQQNHTSNHSSLSAHWEQHNRKGLKVFSFKKHQESPPNIKKGIKTLKQQRKILPKALIGDYRLYNSILYVRLTNCDFSHNVPSFVKSKDTFLRSETAQLESSNKKSNFQIDSSNKNVEFQIVSCSNTRKSAFKIRFKSLPNKADLPSPVSKQSKLQSVSKIKKPSTYHNKLSQRRTKKLLKEHHLLKELSVQIVREDLEKKQECNLYNCNIIICDSDTDNENVLVKNAIDKYLDEDDPLDIPVFHSGEKGIGGKITRRASARKSKINEYEDGTRNSIEINEGASNSRIKRSRKQKTPSKRIKLDSSEKGSDSDNESKATSKQKSEELKNREATYRSESESEEDNYNENNSRTKDRQRTKKLKNQAGEDDDDQKQKKSKSDITVPEKDERTSDHSDEETVIRQPKPSEQKSKELENQKARDVNELESEENKDNENNSRVSDRQKPDMLKEQNGEDESDGDKKQKTKNQKARDTHESESEEDNDDENNSRVTEKQKAEELEKQNEEDEDESNSEKRQNESKGDETVDKNAEESISDGIDKDTRSKHRKCSNSESDDEFSINETEVKPGKNEDVPENITESGVFDKDKVENKQESLEESLQSKEEELEGQKGSKEDKAGGKTDDISEEQSHTSDQPEVNTKHNEHIESMDVHEQGALEENKLGDASHMEDSSIGDRDDSDTGKSWPEKETAQLEESEDQHKQENVIDDDLEDELNDLDKNEVLQNKEINTLENVETDLDQNKECEEQNKHENKDNVLEATENEVTSLDASSCDDDLNNKNGVCKNTDSEGDKLDTEGENEDKTNKRKAIDEISNEPKKSKVDNDVKTLVDGDCEVGKNLAKIFSETPDNDPVVIELLDPEDSEATEKKNEDTNSDKDIENFLNQNSDKPKEVLEGASGNGHIEDVNETLHNTIDDEQLSGSAEEEKCADLSNSSVCSNSTEKKKKKVTFNEESNVTFQ
nr:unnamed protein product [Callosobruchus analis]